MDRRSFLQPSMLGASAFSLGPLATAADDQKDVKITRIVGFDLLTKRSKVAGKNSRLDVHGDRSMDRMIRIETNLGIEGIGPYRASKESVAKLLGTNPFDHFQEKKRQITGPLGRRTTPLWDLIGKLLDKPVYELLGGIGGQQVPVYDGSIYFADLLPQYSAKWQDRFRREIDMALAVGHHAVKIKVGRGAKWMPRDEGNARDVAVVKLIREHAGDDFTIGVDANNGYDLAGAKRFLEKTGEFKLAFAEEMFPETVKDCLEFKAFIREQGWKTLVADGESQREVKAFEPFVEAKAIDVLQGDMKGFGLEGILAEATLAKPKGLLVAPHNWGSLLGYYMQLHIGMAVPNFYMAEHDPLHSDVLLAEGYSRKHGQATVPDQPGLGLAIDQKRFDKETKVHFDLKA